MKAVLFDLDGVLIDTEGTYTRFWSYVDRQYPTGVENFALSIKGSTLANILSTYFPEAETQSRIRHELAEFEADMQCDIFEGVAELLEALKRSNIPAAIVTSSSTRKMERLFSRLKGFKDCFDLVITDEDIVHSKPDPEGYLLAARRLGVDAHDCAVFEDSVAGVIAGHNAGAFVIGVSTTNTPDKLTPYADTVIGSMKDALSALGIAARSAD